MANQEQLELIKEGVEAWNAWRKANLSIRIDLSSGNFSGMNLAGIDLDGDYPVAVPYFMREIIEQITVQARKSKYIDQESGVSAIRFSSAATLMAVTTLMSPDRHRDAYSSIRAVPYSGIKRS